MSEVSPHLTELYEEYYSPSDTREDERHFAARESALVIERLAGRKLGKTIDVGAGDGVLSAEMDSRKLADEIVAIEISESGVARIRGRQLATVSKVVKVDGYKFPFADGEFDTAVCAHVIEHIEHERLFLREIARIAKRLVLVAPLEGGMRGRINREFGHINYYSPMTLTNLLETSGFRVLDSDVFAASLEREKELGGAIKGTLKRLFRVTGQKLLGKYAPHAMVYVMGIYAESTPVTRV